jgi:uncharacterized protein (DUF1501 family)
MNRRKFIRNMSLAGSGAITLGGMPINVLAGNEELKKIAMDASNDRVLVFVQLHGGNDGLNTLIPIDQFDKYKEIRSNIFIPQTGGRSYIPLDNSLPLAQQAGLHPDMQGFKDLYDDNRAAVVHNVGYENMNLSHFRGRDIVFMGGDYNDTYHSGWMGRFLNHEYPDYPESYPSSAMPDPPGIELSGDLSLSYHRDVGIPIGFNINDPIGYYNLVNTVGLDEPPMEFPDSNAGVELKYLTQFEDKAVDYSERLRDVYNAGSNSSVVYPETYSQNAPERFISNPLSGQLKLIARMLDGGIKTRIFLCRMGLFDTHADQVLADDATMGGHAALLYHLSSAIKAFHDDLAAMGIEDRVLTMTFTEFGRRAYSNDSFGTDHGKSTPVFLFGSGLKGGIYGDNPDLTDLDGGGNTKYAIDYRQAYTSVVMDWFGASEQSMGDTYFDPWVSQRLDLIAGVNNINNKENLSKVQLTCTPNPIDNIAVFQLPLKRVSNVKLYIMDTNGKRVATVFQGKKQFGVASFSFDASILPTGSYVAVAYVNEYAYQCKFAKL